MRNLNWKFISLPNLIATLEEKTHNFCIIISCSSSLVFQIKPPKNVFTSYVCPQKQNINRWIILLSTPKHFEDIIRDSITTFQLMILLYTIKKSLIEFLKPCNVHCLCILCSFLNLDKKCWSPVSHATEGHRNYSQLRPKKFGNQLDLHGRLGPLNRQGKQKLLPFLKSCRASLQRSCLRQCRSSLVLSMGLHGWNCCRPGYNASLTSKKIRINCSTIKNGFV